MEELDPDPDSGTAMRIVRILRGILSTAVTWAGLWVPSSLILIGLAVITGNPLSFRVIASVLVSQAIVGAINGIVFGSVLAIAGRRKTFDGLSMRWIALCGAVGGVMFPVVVRGVWLSSLGFSTPLWASVLNLATNALMGAGCAALTLAIARRAPALRAGSETPELETGAKAGLPASTVATTS